MSETQTQRVIAKPNIVFILADDMRKDDTKYMPKTRSLLRERGMGFRNAFVSHPLCAPSRATIMRGQYSHNTGVWSNSSTDSSSTTSIPRGWDRWFALFSSGDLRYFDYDVNDQGTIRHFGTRESDYKTDVLSRETGTFISSSVSEGKP